MPSLIFRRGDSPKEELTNDGTTRNLLITLIVLIVLGIALAGSLFAVRRARKARQAAGTLPTYEDSTRNRNGLSINTRRDSSYVYSEKQQLIESSVSSPGSPGSVPEIRITFPEEEDKDGRRVSGRVVVVQVGEAGVGFVRPLETNEPPAYIPARSQEYSSVDLERIGGLKEIR